MSRAIVLFTRAPSAPGKTRLTAGLDADAAHALRRALLLDTFEAVASVGAPVIVSFTPASARSEIESVIAASAERPGSTEGPGPAAVSAISTAGAGPVAVSAIPQRENCDLGDRIYAALSAARRMGGSQVILVGADLATLPVAHLHDAFAQLQHGSDVVFGPAEDGGYYLVGMNAPALAATKPLFEHIAWGSDAVLSQTLAAAAAASLRTALIAPWFDVDTRTDLVRVGADARPTAARHTREWLAHHPVAE